MTGTLKNTTVYYVVSIYCHSNDCQSSDELWLACCQGGKKAVLRFYSYFLGPDTGISESAGSCEMTWLPPEPWLNLPNGHGRPPNVRRDEGMGREWAAMTAGIESQMCCGCEQWHFQSGQRACSPLWCCVFTKFSRVSSADFTELSCMHYNAAWRVLKPTSPSIYHLVHIISWSSLLKQGDKKHRRRTWLNERLKSGSWKTWKMHLINSSLEQYCNVQW